MWPRWSSRGRQRSCSVRSQGRRSLAPARSLRRSGRRRHPCPTAHCPPYGELPPPAGTPPRSARHCRRRPRRPSGPSSARRRRARSRRDRRRRWSTARWLFPATRSHDVRILTDRSLLRPGRRRLPWCSSPSCPRPRRRPAGRRSGRRYRHRRTRSTWSTGCPGAARASPRPRHRPSRPSAGRVRGSTSITEPSEARMWPGRTRRLPVLRRWLGCRPTYRARRVRRAAASARTRARRWSSERRTTPSPGRRGSRMRWSVPAPPTAPMTRRGRRSRGEIRRAWCDLMQLRPRRTRRRSAGPIFRPRRPRSGRRSADGRALSGRSPVRPAFPRSGKRPETAHPPVAPHRGGRGPASASR
jgi:hypothetical protein